MNMKLARASALSLTRSAQGKTLVPFAEQRRNKVATVFGDFLVVVVVLLLFCNAINNLIEGEVLLD